MIFRRNISIIFILFLATFLFGQGKVNPNYHSVRGHFRNGTYVAPYKRTNPNSTNRDNYSTQGNTNPWTGQAGWVQPDNNPLPSYGNSTWTPSTSTYPSSNAYTPPSTSTFSWPSPSTSPQSTYDYTPSTTPSYNNDYRTTEYSSRKSSSSAWVAGAKTIYYKDGKETFNVLSTSKTNFKPNLTYYFYDPDLNEVSSAEGHAYGQLLSGKRRMVYDDGRTLEESNYKNGLKHGLSISYDEDGNEELWLDFKEGVIVGYRAVNDEGFLVEWNGTPFDKNSVRTFSKNGIINKKEIYQNKSSWKSLEYDQFTGSIQSEITFVDNTLTGPFKLYHSDGKTLKRVGAGKNGELHGEIKDYAEDGTLLSIRNFSEGKREGYYEIRNERGQLTEKGTCRNDQLNGLIEIHDYDEDIHIKTAFTDDERDGIFEKRKGQNLIVRGAYSHGEPEGKWDYFIYKEGETTPSFSAYSNFRYGTRHGAFKEIRNDSILVGSYENDLLDGQLKIYQPFEFWLFGSLPSQLDDNDIIAEGEMSRGKMEGTWKFYDASHTLVREGWYFNDLKHGEFKYYFPSYVDEDGNPKEYSGKLFLIENYLNGLKNGKSERFSSLEKTQVMCDTSIGTVNPLDTCFKMNWVKEYELIYYKNDELHGPFEVRDSLGLVSKGNFLKGKKDGTWKFREENELITTGDFADDKRIGVWRELWPDEKGVFRETKYNNGLRDGTSAQYDYFGNMENLAVFEKGLIQSVTKFDSLTKRASHIYENIEYHGEYCYFTETSFSQDTIFKADVRMIFMFSNQQSDQIFFLSEAENFTKTFVGALTVSKRNGDKILTGEFSESVPVKDWSYYFYDQRIRQKLTFENGEKKSESFWSMPSDKPFSGEFLTYHDNKKILARIQVKDGLRHGKTKVFFENGKLEKVKKYKKGVLVKGTED